MTLDMVLRGMVLSRGVRWRRLKEALRCWSTRPRTARAANHRNRLTPARRPRVTVLAARFARRLRAERGVQVVRCRSRPAVRLAGVGRGSPPCRRLDPDAT